ncbi:helix-turn-helix domain-containing protein [Amycolatopsis sp. FDAARGOS 1241]|uniref:MmyB family transcriptional regulator n=1 Tax=Amycolatopsis sp. FDAARGOS 1241 TaxID=2778070 RepID=UPI001950E0DE|nr:helix-turn-helix domain-containing protein [Amycolatopsis sp. FDAARGOS 1241]QRP49159.1 helix-turn-helix domain-containing protein [Amycolatopsis sp. FDAARGOS 1241]
MNRPDELAKTLRGWRERLVPGRAGLPVHGQRRARGLRREELAVLAGLAADHVVRLEQGRAAAPGVQVCVALARALRLSDAEQERLFRLAGHELGGGRVPRLVPESTRRLLERLDDHPIAVHDAMWTLIAWNRPWAALMGEPAARDEDRNAVWRHFAARPTRTRLTPDERAEFEHALVADLRLAQERYPREPDLTALLGRLASVSTGFRALWDSHPADGQQPAGLTVDHPDVGRLDLDRDVLASRHGDLRIVVCTARPGTESAAKLALLGALGFEAMAPPG